MLIVESADEVADDEPLGLAVVRVAAVSSGGESEDGQIKVDDHYS